MKSWAHTYMAGSLLGTVLIVAALIAFVPLVSLSAPDEWPTPGLGLDTGGAKDNVGVGTAVVVAARHPQAAGLDSNPAAGPSVVADVPSVAIVTGQGLRTGSSGGAETEAPEQGAVAISPASAEVVARNPGSPAPEGSSDAGSPPSLTETGNAPVPAATDGEADVGDRGEAPPPAPIDAGVGAGDSESQPPERPESAPPPPSGSSAEGDGVPPCPEEAAEGGDPRPGDISPHH